MKNKKGYFHNKCRCGRLKWYTAKICRKCFAKGKGKTVTRYINRYKKKKT